MNKGAYYVVELLKSLNKKEISRLQALSNTTYFNTEKKVVVLLDILLKTIHDNKPKIEWSLLPVYNTLYHTQLSQLNKTQRSNLYSIMSSLHQLVQQFLTLEALQDNEKIKATLLQEQLLKRKQYRSFEKFVKIQQKILQQTELSVELYEHQFVIEQGILSYTQQIGGSIKQNNIGSIKDSLTFYYLLQQMDLYLMELYLNELTTSHNIDFEHYRAIEPLLQLKTFAQNPLLQIYQSTIELMATKTEASFFQLVKLLDFYDTSIPIYSLINFYNSMLNFCVLQVRSGKTAYKNHQLDLYKTMDTKNLLFDDDQIHIGNLRNIVGISCQLNDFNWANYILKKYVKFLPDNLKESIVNFNLGTMAYLKKDYQLAIDYLFPLPNINLSHDINRRTTIIKAYYELDIEYLETTHTLFRSFEKYIREHKNLTGKSKTSYKNFIRTLINLYRIKHNVTKMKLENLKQKLVAQMLNSNKSWLLEKIGELEMK